MTVHVARVHLRELPLPLLLQNLHGRERNVILGSSPTYSLLVTIKLYLSRRVLLYVRILGFVYKTMHTINTFLVVEIDIFSIILKTNFKPLLSRH